MSPPSPRLNESVKSPSLLDGIGTGNQYGAGPSLLGYLYQCRLALLLTLRKTKRDPGLQVSIERFDDVSFDEGASALERIQTKHHLRKPGSLSDRSPDLWKTLRVWSDGVVNRAIDLSTSALTIITTGKASPGTAASYLRDNNRDPSLAGRILGKIAADGTKESQHENHAAYVAYDGLPSADQESKEIFIPGLRKQRSSHWPGQPEVQSCPGHQR
jgi:hypothetical protein